jgi:hypothetical protein
MCKFSRIFWVTKPKSLIWQRQSDYRFEPRGGDRR